MDQATLEKVNKRENLGTVRDENKSTRQLLSEQPKMSVTLHQNRPGEDQLGDKMVGINGYNYQIKRGKRVDVPESVYLVLVQAGEVTPQRDEDEQYVPRMTYIPGKPLSEQDAANIQ